VLYFSNVNNIYTSFKLASANYLKGCDVILVSSCNYNMHTKNMLNAQIIAEEFAERNVKVLFVESLGLKDIPLRAKSDIVKVFYRIRDFFVLIFRGVSKPCKNIYVLSLIRLPFEKYLIIKKINRLLITFFISRYSNRYLGKKRILWMFLPTTHYLVRSFKNNLSIYHCVDDYSEVPNVDKNFILKEEHEMLKSVDLIFTVSRNLKEKFDRYSLDKDIIYINNVARYGLYHRALSEKVVIPPLMKKIVNERKPIIGYMGNIASYKENLELMYKVTKSSPEFNYVLIGPVGSGEVGTDISSLRKLSNVFLLGPVEYNQLYRYFKFFDVATIYRRINKANEGGFPLKYFEYLASGLPVVVTDISSLHEFSFRREFGGIANTSNEFIERFKYWIDMKKNNIKKWKEFQKIRLDCARVNSWEKRMTDFDSIVGKYLD